jgi:hypothetical protein
MFREYFGTALLSDSFKPTMVTALDLTTGQPFFLNSAKAVRNVGNDVLMWQAARATTAVPTHCSPLRLSISDTPFRRARETCLADGSLFASNPAMCALAEARSLFPGEDDFLLISLGCGSAVAEAWGASALATMAKHGTAERTTARGSEVTREALRARNKAIASVPRARAKAPS